MNRITEKQLEFLVARLNELTGSPKESWTRNGDGQLHANIGNYHLSYAYGGVCLHRMMNEHGGVTTPLSYGHVPKRELYDALHAFLRGIELGKGEAA